MESHHRTQPSSAMYGQRFCNLYIVPQKREMCVPVPTFLLCVFIQLKPTCHVMQKDGSNRVYRWTECDFWVSVAKYTHYPVSNISTFPGQMICNTVTTLHKLWQEDGLVRKFCNKITTKSNYINTMTDNFRFSPCIIIVNHFYCPTNVLNYTNLEVKIYVV